MLAEWTSGISLSLSSLSLSLSLSHARSTYPIVKILQVLFLILPFVAAASVHHFSLSTKELLIGLHGNHGLACQDASVVGMAAKGPPASHFETVGDVALRIVGALMPCLQLSSFDRTIHSDIKQPAAALPESITSLPCRERERERISLVHSASIGL